MKIILLTQNFCLFIVKFNY